MKRWLLFLIPVVALVSWLALHPTHDFTHADRARIQAQLKWPQECENAFVTTESDPSGLHYYELGEGRRLIQVACANGAYQGSYLYMMQKNSDAATLLTWPLYDSYEVWGTPLDFDAGRKQIGFMFKTSGVDPCHEQRIYSLESDTPVLVSHESVCIEE